MRLSRPGGGSPPCSAWPAEGASDSRVRRIQPMGRLGNGPKPSGINCEEEMELRGEGLFCSVLLS